MEEARLLESRSQRIACRKVLPARKVPSLLDDVREGLMQEPRKLPAKYFYDKN